MASDHDDHHVAQQAHAQREDKLKRKKTLCLFFVLEWLQPVHSSGSIHSSCHDRILIRHGRSLRTCQDGHHHDHKSESETQIQHVSVEQDVMPQRMTMTLLLMCEQE